MDSFLWMDSVYRMFFLVDILINVFVDEHQKNEGPWTVRKSCVKQVKSKLILDVIAIFPFQSLFDGVVNARYLQQAYFLKVVRMYHGLDLIDYKKYKMYLNQEQSKRIQNMIKDP
mmetsp:Transcript_38839/g.59045  ORF Transcript_38839/g.59045 Transcript_38839/m.59045 type:complete len:115 (+) Transcript_38839:884-1228(+)